MDKLKKLISSIEYNTEGKIKFLVLSEGFDLYDIEKDGIKLYDIKKWKEILRCAFTYLGICPSFKENEVRKRIIVRYIFKYKYFNTLSKLINKTAIREEDVLEIFETFLRESSEIYRKTILIDESELFSEKEILNGDHNKKKKVIKEIIEKTPKVTKESPMSDLKLILDTKCLLVFKDLYGYEFWNKKINDILKVLIDERVSSFSQLIKKKTLKTYVGNGLVLYCGGKILPILDRDLLPILVAKKE